MSNTCSTCDAAVDQSDRYCRACGKGLQDTALPWHHRRPVVLVLLFFVLGPLGIRLLWNSPAFSLRERVWFSIASLSEVLIVATLMVKAYVGFLLGIAGLDQL